MFPASYLMFQHRILAMRIEIISGSPRQGSITHRLALHLLQRLEAGGVDAGMIALKDHSLPFVQTVWSQPEAAPAEHKSLAERMFAADGFILVSPEYNGIYSAALGNLFDHFPKQARKAFGLAPASTGGMGGIRSALHMQQLVYGLFGVGSPFMLVTPLVDKKFDAEGNLLDAAFDKQVHQFVHEFLWLARSLTGASVEEKAVA